LQAAGLPSNDETAWRLLRRLQILVFDFCPSSAAEQLAKERAARALHPDSRAASLWAALVELAWRSRRAAAIVSAMD
jgi:hypothetical protein